MSLPTFHQDITLDADLSYLIVLRYYAPCPDGTPGSWQQPVSLPQIITENGTELTIDPYFPAEIAVCRQNRSPVFDPTPYLRGQEQGGFDQHAQYWQCGIESASTKRKITVQGEFQKAGYFSVVAYAMDNGGLRHQEQFFDYQMTSDNNPYIPGHSSVFDYASTVPPCQPLKNHESPERVSTGTGNTMMSSVFRLPHPERGAPNGFYRINKEMAATRYTEENTPDGCSRGYLTTILFEWQEVAILRIKVPSTFVSSDSPDVIFGDYQCRELSVSANVKSIDTVTGPVLDFWTVSSRMLNDWKDEEGFAVIFFAPNDYVSSLVKEQGLEGLKVPPVLTWGRYKGYVLGYPDYSIVIRYRAPSDTWQGNPQNCYCALDYAEMIYYPATTAELGDWLPDLHGGSFEAFTAGTIGLINQNEPWPGS